MIEDDRHDGAGIVFGWLLIFMMVLGLFGQVLLDWAMGYPGGQDHYDIGVP